MVINNNEIQVDSYKFLGVTISSILKWWDNTTTIFKKSTPEAFIFKTTKKVVYTKDGMMQFYITAIERILTHTLTVWFYNMRKGDNWTK